MSPSSRSFAEILKDAYVSYLVLNAWNRTLLAFWNLFQNYFLRQKILVSGFNLETKISTVLNLATGELPDLWHHLFFLTIVVHSSSWSSACSVLSTLESLMGWIAEMSTDQDWIGLDQDWSQFGSDCNFFQNWRIRTGSDWENFCCFNVIILKISKFLVVIGFHRFAKW